MRRAYFYIIAACPLALTFGTHASDECTDIPFERGSSLLQDVSHLLYAAARLGTLSGREKGTLLEDLKLAPPSRIFKPGDWILASGITNASQAPDRSAMKTDTSERYLGRIAAHRLDAKDAQSSPPRAQVESQGATGTMPSETHVHWFQWGAESEVCIGIFFLAGGLAIASLYYAGALDLSPPPKTANEILNEVYATAQQDKPKTAMPSPPITTGGTRLKGYIRVRGKDQHLPQQLVAAETPTPAACSGGGTGEEARATGQERGEVKEGLGDSLAVQLEQQAKKAAAQREADLKQNRQLYTPKAGSKSLGSEVYATAQHDKSKAAMPSPPIVTGETRVPREKQHLPQQLVASSSMSMASNADRQPLDIAHNMCKHVAALVLGVGDHAVVTDTV